MSWLNIAAPIISGYFGYRGAQNQAQQQAANNALLKEQYKWEKSKEVPAVTGAQNQLSAGRWVDKDGNPVAAGTAGARWQSQFEPFINAAGQQAVAGSNIAQQYLANVPYYQQSGLAGLAGYADLSQQSNIENQDALARQYTDLYGRGLYDIAARDINRQADNQNRASSAQGGRFGALSSQRARQAGQIDQKRTESLLDAARQARETGYNRAQAELQRRQGLAGALTSLGTTGLSQAQQASTLGSGAQQYGIQAPFLPFQQYGATIGAIPSASAPTYGTVTDPFTTGIGLGLQTWNTFNKQGG